MVGPLPRVALTGSPAGPTVDVTATRRYGPRRSTAKVDRTAVGARVPSHPGTAVRVHRSARTGRGEAGVVHEVPDQAGGGASPGGAQPGEQAALFPDASLPDELVGYRGAAACQIAGITYRQLDYWARTGLVAPSIRTAHGSGSQRLYSFKDILVLKVVKRLLDTGVSLQNIRVAVD